MDTTDAYLTEKIANSLISRGRLIVAAQTFIWAPVNICASFLNNLALSTKEKY